MPHTSLDFRRRFRSAPSQRNEDATAATTETNSYKRKSSRVSPYGRLRRKLDAKRREEESALFVQTNERSHDPGETSSPTSPPTSAPTTQQHKDGHEQSTTSSSSNNNNNNTEQKKDENSISRLLLGTPMENPIRRHYIESQRPWKYPRTIQGWRICFQRAWATYLWTWEGWLLPEKKRDEHGNVVVEEPDKGDGDDNDTSTKETIKEKAADAANQISQNVQKNISTIQQEAPKLLSTAQKLTGISTREELREWVSKQLKLGTECLSMFMKGYREGRDEEVDKMLHEYFKELDQDKGNETLTKEGSESIKKESIDRSGHDIGSESKVVQKRPWGRKERRRFKATAQQIPMVDMINS